MDKNRFNIEDIIRNSLSDQRALQKEYYLFGNLLYIQEPFAGDVDVHQVIGEIEAGIPSYLFDEVDTIMVGVFDFLDERDLEAVYKDGAIYVSSRIINNRDLLENIIHEMAHSLEASTGHYIYGDFKMEREFAGKRKTLERILDSSDAPAHHLDFKNLEYDKDFDEYLYLNLGYPLLQSLTNGLFHTPYAITSLREYWASGVEDYFLGDRDLLKRISPELFNKIEGIITHEH